MRASRSIGPFDFEDHICVPLQVCQKHLGSSLDSSPHAERAKSTWPWLQIRGDALALKKKVNRRLWFFGGSPPDIEMTNRNYDDARRAALDFATKAGSENVAPLLSTRDLRERMEKGERVVIVPWRFLQVIAVSYLCIDIYTKKASRRHRCVCIQGYTCTLYIYIYIMLYIHTCIRMGMYTFFYYIYESDIVGNIYNIYIYTWLHVRFGRLFLRMFWGLSGQTLRSSIEILLDGWGTPSGLGSPGGLKVLVFWRECALQAQVVLLSWSQSLVMENSVLDDPPRFLLRKNRLFSKIWFCG